MTEMDTARRLITRGQTEEAARLLAERIAEKPDDKEAWLLMAAAVSEPRQKLDCFQRVLQIDPTDAAAKKGKEAAKKQISLRKGKKTSKKSPAKQARKKKPKAEVSIPISPLKKLTQTKVLLPAILFILFTTAAVLVLKFRPVGSTPPLPATLAALPTKTPSSTMGPSTSATENPQDLFATLPFSIFFAREGKLWIWQGNSAKALADIDASAPLMANGQTGQVLFTFNGNLWQIAPGSLSAYLFAHAGSAQQGTPSPTSSPETIMAAGILPATRKILIATVPLGTPPSAKEQAALYSAQEDGSQVKSLITAGESGALHPSPDEKWLAVARPDSIHLVSLANGTSQEALAFIPIPDENGYLLPSIHWAEDSSRFLVSIPTADYFNNLNAPTTLWQINLKGQKSAFPPIQNRGGVILLTGDLQSVIYQLNLSTTSDYFGEIHRAAIDGSRDAILFDGQKAHLIGLDATGARAVFHFQDSPYTLRMEDPGMNSSLVIQDGLDADRVLSLTWMDEHNFLYQTAQSDLVRLWLAKFDGSRHEPLMLAENPNGEEIPTCFAKK